MKNWLKLSLFAVLLTIFFMACNKQEMTTEATELSETTTTERQFIGPLPYGAQPDEAGEVAYLYAANSDETDDAANEGGDYCVYEILSIYGPRMGGLTPGSILCVDCPTPPTCPGDHYWMMFEIHDALGRACQGDMMLTNPPHRHCLDCPEGGHTGYVFM